ncbi:MAG TPA: phosphotransferase [Microlunatus sp.]|nr:phosphotransferase [Microlunatus sp.]
MQTGRRASVVLVHRGEVLGRLPPVELEMPWWPEADDLVSAVRERDGIEITVLRLLHTASDRVSGGEVTYLAEADRPPPGKTTGDWPADPLADQPLRQTWARPGGPTELLAWADQRLELAGRERIGRAQQMRTWNLSALWRIPTREGRVWLKAVPDFFAHEGAVIDWIGVPVAPQLVDFSSGRSLLVDIAGPTNHELRDAEALLPMVELLTGLQHRALDRTDELIVLGVPDRRLRTVVDRAAAVVEEWGAAIELSARRSLEALVSELPARVAAVADCGVPDTLVHGDFHAGNVAGRPGGYVILDWGDSFIGHPLLDELAFVEPLPPLVQDAARSWFVAAWERIVPGSEPARAAELLGPLVSVEAAAMYARFCAAIEPDERVYHASDVVRMLRRAVASRSA